MTNGQPAFGDEPETLRGDAFVDGRVDSEKLAELLTFPEGAHLDFKASLDLDSTEGKVKFAKDVIAMSNCPPGGYILIGVDDSGKPCVRTGAFDRPRFDAARLGDVVRSYVEGHVELRVGIPECGESEVIVIYVFPHPDGLPVPMSKVGDYPDPKGSRRSVTHFRAGDVPVREGAANVHLRHVHWQRILADYERRVRAEGTALAQALLREFVDERASARATDVHRPTEIPLLVDMEEATFARAVQAALESERGDVRLRRFLKVADKSVTLRSNMDDFCTALDKRTILCAQALYAERNEFVLQAIETLHQAYEQVGVGVDDARRRLEIVVRIYALGSTAIRMKAWEVVHALALQPTPSNPFDTSYIYSSWIRHGQVEGSRAGLIPNDRGGFLISAPRELLVGHPAMRPDVEDSELPPSDEIATDDLLLNAPCQFDLAYCFVVAAEGQHHGAYYPSSVALKDERAAPAALAIVGRPATRRQLFPNADDSAIAEALAQVYDLAEREAGKYRMWWDMPGAVANFVRQHRIDGS